MSDIEGALIVRNGSYRIVATLEISPYQRPALMEKIRLLKKDLVTV